MQETIGGRHLNATFRIYVCMLTRKTPLTSTDKYTHIHTLSTFLGEKILHCPPAKNREEFPVTAFDNVRKHQENCKRYLGDTSQF